MDANLPHRPVVRVDRRAGGLGGPPARRFSDFTLARRARGLLSAVVVALLVSGVVSCGGGGQAGNGAGTGPDVVRIGVLPTSGIAPLYVGQEQGFYERRGIEIETQVGAGGAAIVPAVMAGDLDIGYGASVSSAIARAKGLPVTIVAQGIIGASSAQESINKVVVASSSDISSAADLEGKTVAVNTLGSVAEILIKAVLEEEYGVDVSAVEFIEVPLPEMLQTLEAGQADAVWATEPFLSQAESQGHRALFSMDAEFAPNTSLASYFTSEKFIAEHPDLVERFVAATNDSLRYAQEHPDEVRAAVKKYLDIPEAAVDSMTLPLWDADLHVDTIERQARYAVDYGLIDSLPDMGDLVYQAG